MFSTEEPIRWLNEVESRLAKERGKDPRFILRDLLPSAGQSAAAAIEASLMFGEEARLGG